MSSDPRDYAPSQANVVILSGDRHLADLASQAAREAGALPCLVESIGGLDSQPGCPVAVIRGADISSDVDQAITSAWPTAAVAVACLGFNATSANRSSADAVTERFSGPSRSTTSDRKNTGQAGFALPDQTDDLVQWVEATLVPERDQRRIAVVAASGGIGATTVAVALARQLAQDRAAGASLVDFNPAGTPLTALVGTDPNAPGWTDMLESGQPAPDCQPGGVCLIGGARAIDPRTEAAQLRQVIEAVESVRPGATTIIDASAAAPLSLRRLAGWCDHAVLLTRADPIGQAAVLPLARAAQQAGCPVTLVIRPVRGGLDRTDLAALTGASDCVVLKDDRALAYGGQPSNRPRGPVSRVAAHLARTICTNTDNAAWVEKPPSPTKVSNNIGPDVDELIWSAPPRRRVLPWLGGRRSPQPVSWPLADADTDLVETVTMAKLGLDPVDPPSHQTARAALGPDGQPEVFAGTKTGPRLSWRQRQDLRPTPVDLGDWTEEW